MQLASTEIYAGRKVHRVNFRPNKHKDASGNQGDWKGEALVDAEEFQPVNVKTDLAIGIPLPVRILLGTSVHGIGFNVSYQRLDDGRTAKGWAGPQLRQSAPRKS